MTWLVHLLALLAGRREALAEPLAPPPAQAARPGPIPPGIPVHAVGDTPAAPSPLAEYLG
ncbi:hypothetical protein QE401_002209 [Pseudoroseomonas cervicalis]|nr:hypothetical protein [Pseudoroseomonas cervicalis]